MSDELTLTNIKERLNLVLSPTTAKTYISHILAINKQFKNIDLGVLLNDNSKVIEWINTNPKFKSPSTRRGYFAAILFVMNEFNLSTSNKLKIKSLIQNEMSLSIIQQTASFENDILPLKDAQDTMDKIKLKYYELKANMDPVKYDQNRMLAAYLHLVLFYGVIRLDELYNMPVFDESSTVANYIDRSRKMMIIRDHKTKKQYPIKKIVLSDEFMDIIEPSRGALFYSGKGMVNMYNTAQGLERMIFSKLGYRHYDLRKMKSSIALATSDINEIHKLGLIQGHNLATQLKYYNKYRKLDDLYYGEW